MTAVVIGLAFTVIDARSCDTTPHASSRHEGAGHVRAVLRTEEFAGYTGTGTANCRD
jgi:hypothetical protein